MLRDNAITTPSGHYDLNRFVSTSVDDVKRYVDRCIEGAQVKKAGLELGNGSIDFTRIWPDTGLAGMKHFFVEQGGNFTRDPFTSIADSAAYVKRVLKS